MGTATREPLFEKYRITGRTYTTGSGTVGPNELQYYGGEMAHFYGECTDTAAVEDALAGSGYRAVTLKYAGGRRAAIAQLWVSRFTDTTIGPYGAMFIVVVVVPDRTPDGQASIPADSNGASSALAMFDGSFDHAAGCTRTEPACSSSGCSTPHRSRLTSAANVWARTSGRVSSR